MAALVRVALGASLAYVTDVQVLLESETLKVNDHAGTAVGSGAGLAETMATTAKSAGTAKKDFMLRYDACKRMDVLDEETLRLKEGLEGMKSSGT